MRKKYSSYLAFVLFVFMFGTLEAQPPMGRGPKGPPSTGEVLQTQPFLSPGEKRRAYTTKFSNRTYHPTTRCRYACPRSIRTDYV